jgi:hypothetical protein
MDISNINSSITSSINRTDPLTAATASDSSTTSTDSSLDTSSSTVGISTPGQFLSSLQSLMQNDPTKAKDVLDQLATQVRDDASKTTGDQATRLNDFADKLQQAGDSGSMSPLTPKAHGGHGGHHHHGGGGGGGAAEAGVAAAASSSSAAGGSSASAAYASNATTQTQGAEFWNSLNTSLNSLLSGDTSTATGAVQLG